MLSLRWLFIDETNAQLEIANLPAGRQECHTSKIVVLPVDSANRYLFKVPANMAFALSGLAFIPIRI